MKKKKVESIPYDQFLKQSLSYPAMIKWFIKSYFEKELKEKLDLSSIKMVNSNSITRNLRERRRDLTYQIDLKNGEIMFLHIENELKSSKVIGLRCLDYSVLVITDFMMQEKGKKAGERKKEIPVVKSFCYYHGKKKYIHDTNFVSKCPSGVNDWEELRKKVTLIDLSTMRLEEICTHGPLALVEIFSKYRNEKRIDKILVKLKPKIEEWLKEVGEEYLETLLGYSLRLSKPIAEKIFRFFNNEFEEELKEYTMTYEYYLRKEGRKEGMKEGKVKWMAEGRRKGNEEGRRKGKAQVAKKMIERGMDLKLVSDITGLGSNSLKGLM